MKKLFGLYILICTFISVFAVKINIVNESGHTLRGGINTISSNYDFNDIIPEFRSEKGKISFVTDLFINEEINEQERDELYLLGSLELNDKEYSFVGVTCLLNTITPNKEITIIINNNESYCLLE